MNTIPLLLRDEPQLFPNPPSIYDATDPPTRILHWLLENSPFQPLTGAPLNPWPPNEGLDELTHLDARGDGERTIASVKRVLRKTGVRKALSRAKWMP